MFYYLQIYEALGCRRRQEDLDLQGLGPYNISILIVSRLGTTNSLDQRPRSIVYQGLLERHVYSLAGVVILYGQLPRIGGRIKRADELDSRDLATSLVRHLFIGKLEHRPSSLDSDYQ
jgi:hypothetical protein